MEVKVQNTEHEFYRSVAEITEGCHVTLEQFTEMTDVITAIVSHIVGPESLEVGSGRRLGFKVLDLWEIKRREGGWGLGVRGSVKLSVNLFK